MSIPSPPRTPRKNPDAGHPLSDQPVVPPDDPNANRLDRVPDIDPPPIDPPLEAPADEPGTVEPPARACGPGSFLGTDEMCPAMLRVWMMVGLAATTCPSGGHTGLGAR